LERFQSNRQDALDRLGQNVEDAGCPPKRSHDGGKARGGALGSRIVGRRIDFGRTSSRNRGSTRDGRWFVPRPNYGSRSDRCQGSPRRSGETGGKGLQHDKEGQHNRAPHVAVYSKTNVEQDRKGSSLFTATLLFLMAQQKPGGASLNQAARSLRGSTDASAG
jgi:hypothetical protein